MGPARRTKAPGVRARVRAELTAEIKSAARRQLAAEGATSLSLRAIARELSMASSAIYRYFPSRDELLTALIVDAYNSIGEVAERAEEPLRRDDVAGRFAAIAHAVRNWARAAPHEYALIYGSPVPGYAAPDDTVDPALRVPSLLLGILIDWQETAPASARPPSEVAPAHLADALRDVMSYTSGAVPAPRLALGIEAWAEIIGLISLELFGHFHNAVAEPDILFAHAIDAMIDRLFR